ncbi:MAG: TolC family outer membrane protein [Hyphomicrobiaceae bacterium]
MRCVVFVMDEVRGVARRIGCVAALLAAVCGLVAGISVSAQAETLKEALASAYRSNPALLAERKRVEATDEGVPQARSGFRPRLIARGDVAREYTNTRPRTGFVAPRPRSGSTTEHGYEIEFSQSLFNGFRTVNSVRQAEANVLVARESLREIEQSTLLAAVTAYMDVIRDRAIVRLRENNVRVLSGELHAAQVRFDAGDATKTDVAQARARRAGTLSSLNLAKANLRASRADYVRVIGHSPGDLTPPPPASQGLPESLTAAIELAQTESPNVVQAAFREISARHEVDIVSGELLPEVNLEGSYEQRLGSSLTTAKNETAQVGGRLTVPLYQGGEVFARIRAAKRNRERRAQQIEEARQAARASAVRAWSDMGAARAQLAAARVEVEANRTALIGVRAEERVGQRTVLDVLDAEQEFLDAQNNLVSIRRDLVVASYSLLAATGRLTAGDANLNVELHDPEVYYDLVHPKFWGTSVTPNEDYDGYAIEEDWIE